VSSNAIGNDTIAALASGEGRSGVAVIRMSGPKACAALEAISGAVPAPRRATIRRIHDSFGSTLDHALVLWMPGPASFTGEDVAEFHVHGGRAVVASVLRALFDTSLVRPAEAGEFTRRAFEAGRLDLAEVEGLADLIEAETEAQHRQAIRQFEGALGTLVAGWRDRLIALLALVEAEIDFPDEGLPDGLVSSLGPDIDAMIGEVTRVAAEAERGMRVRDGIRVVILGAPNAGKSTLLNALSGRKSAIVSPIPGTTRDVVEVRLVLAGVPVWIADTAGLREAADVIEEEGVRRALERAGEADIRILLIDGSLDVAPNEGLDLLRSEDILVRSKADQQRRGAAVAAERLAERIGAHLVDHAPQSNEVIEALTSLISLKYTIGGGALVTRERQRHALLAAMEHLKRAEAGLSGPPELVGEDVRLAVRSLESITGKVDVEDVLGRIFSTFCIGK
jgi:tRNA modification GTPase